MNFNVYSFGNGNILVDAFNAIAMIAGSSMINSAIMVAVLAGFILFLAGGVFSPTGHTNLNWKWLVGWVLILEALWVPRVNVQVVDQNYQFVNPGPAPLIPNVPLGLAVSAHLASTMGLGMTQVMETAFGDPSGVAYSQNGLGFSQNILSTSTQAYFIPSQVKTDVDAYIEACVMLDILAGNKSAVTLANSQNLIADISSTSARIVYLGSPPTMYYCALAYPVIQTELAAYKPTAYSNWVTHTFPMQSASASTINNAVATEIGTTLVSTYNKIGDAAATQAQDLIMQSMMIHQMGESLTNFVASNGGSGAPTLLNVGLAQADQHSKNQWVIAGELAKKYLPMFRGMAEGFIYGLFPVVFLGALLPGGGRIMKMYGIGVLWIQSWSPLYSILNHYIFQYSAQAINGAPGLSMANIININSGSQDMLAVLGIMGTTIPMVALGIIKGAEAGGSAMLGAIGQGMSSAASGAGSVATTGNVSLGNVSMRNMSLDNENYMNRTRYQMNDAVSVTVGAHSMYYDNQRGYASGTRYDLGSSGPMHLEYASGVSTQIESKIKSAKDDIQTHRAAYESAMGANIHQVESLKESATHTHQDGMQYTSGQSASVGSHYQNAWDAVGNFVKSQGLDMNKQAEYITQAMASMEMSGGLRAFGTGVTADMSEQGRVSHKGQTTFESNLKQLEEVLHKEGVQNIKDDMRNYASQRTAGIGDSTNATVTKDMEANFSKADSSVKQASEAYTRLEQWQRTQQYAEQHSMDMKTDGDVWINKAVETIYGAGSMESVMADPVKRGNVYREAQQMAQENFLATARQSVEGTVADKLSSPLESPSGNSNDQQVRVSAGAYAGALHDNQPYTVDSMRKKVDGQVDSVKNEIGTNIRNISDADAAKTKTLENNFNNKEFTSGSVDFGAINRTGNKMPDLSQDATLLTLDQTAQNLNKAPGKIMDAVNQEIDNTKNTWDHYKEELDKDPRSHFFEEKKEEKVSEEK